MILNYLNKNKPILRLIEIALQFWIVSQCEEVEDLKIRLDGSPKDIIGGRVEKISLTARKVIFKKITLSKLDIKTSPINIELNLSRNKDKLKFKHNFNIKGCVIITFNDLNNLFQSEDWEWLGDWLAINLMGLSKVDHINIIDKRIIISAYDKGEVKNLMSAEFSIKADSGTIYLEDLITTQGKHLPMDSSIDISKAIIVNKELLLEGEALVSP